MTGCLLDKSMRNRKKKRALPVKQKSSMGGSNPGSWWNSLGASYGGSTNDPSPEQLVRAYDDITYACVSLIASNISHVPIKLYVKTATGQTQPKCLCGPSLRTKSIGTDVREVIEHPLLSLLNNCNAFHNRHDMLELTQIYLDLTGNAYWLLSFNNIGIPEELYLLPSQNVTCHRNDDGFIDEWILNQGSKEKKYSVDEIIHYKYGNPADLYGLGTSPLKGAWGRTQISGKELDYLTSYLENQGKPDAVLAIKDSMSPIEAERVSKEFRQRYQGSGNGGLLVLDGTMNLQPLNFPAKDLAELQLYQTLKTVICNCFHIPVDIFESGASSNRSTREAAIYSLAAQCLAPRIQRLVQKLNDKLIPYFDTRFFFEADSVIPEDKDYELSLQQMLISQQVVTRDELRVRHGFQSYSWAREPLLPSGVMPLDAFEPDDPVPAPEPVIPPVDRAAQATAVMALQQAYYGGLLPREAGIAQLQILYGFSPEQAAALLPEMPPKPPTPPPGATPPPEAPPAPEQPKPPQEDEVKGSGCTSPLGFREPLATGPTPILTQKTPGAIDDEEAGKDATRGKDALQLPDFRQSTSTDCGACSTRMVASYFGVGAQDEDEFIADLGTDKDGTNPEAIVSYLQSLALQVQAREGMGIEDLAQAIDLGCPVIASVPDHWIVVTGVSDTQVSVHDPLTGPGEIPLEAFLKGWHDIGYSQYGIQVCGAEAKSKSARHGIRMKSPLPLVKAVRGFFNSLSGEVLSGLSTKAVGERWFDEEAWAKSMEDELGPLLQSYYNFGAKEAVASLNLGSGLFNTVQPKLREGAAKAVGVFCADTLATTHLALDDAVAALKQEVAEGTHEGDSRNALMERVQTVFTEASNERAYRIGVSESSRAQHNAQILTAKESGVVKTKTWLLSSDACDLCLPLSNKSVGLDDAFITDGVGPYSSITAPPRHCYCRCTLLLDT